MVPAKWVYMQSFFYQIGITSRDETGLSFGLCYPMVMSPDTVALCFSALNGYTADADTVFIDIQFYDSLLVTFQTLDILSFGCGLWEFGKVVVLRFIAYLDLFF